MSRKKNRAAIAVACMLLASTSLLLLASCNKDPNPTPTPDPDPTPTAVFKQGTYRTYTSVMPSNWNELSYSDNNDTQILSYISGAFYEYDYEYDEAKGGKYNADGSINTDAIVPGGFSVNYSAATKLEDVTSTVATKWGYTADQKSEGGYAWKITLRDDLKWSDGTAITSEDFIYTMKEQLNPDFQNMRASSFYNNICIKNSRNYLFSKEAESYVPIKDQGYATVADAVAAGKTVYYDAVTFWNATGYVDENGNGIPAYLSIDDETLYDTKDAWANGEAVDLFSAKEVYEAYYGSDLSDDDFFVTVPNANLNMSFDEVGLYAPSATELVVCLDNPIQCLKEDGSLSYQAAYSFASLPLVKKSLYESCKQAPQLGSTLWTSNYNSSLETSESWGPYKLTQFQSGKSYTLERNDNWYGYKQEENKNQYNVTKIECEQIAETNSQWMAFLGGNIDSIGLDVNHKDDYRNSKYTLYTPGTGTFGLNLYANPNVLKKSGRNNGILAITDFRKAISLTLDRDDYNSTCYTSHRSCYGLLGPSYYYDIENGGVYRDTEYAKKGLLRVYGFTENSNGTWTDGNRTYASYEDAYDAMNGLNPTLAKQLIDAAYDEMVANAEYYGYDASKQIEFVFGTSTDNESTRRQYDYFVKFFDEMTKGTKLEGKIKITFNAQFGSNWSNDFKQGAYELASGTGFSGGAFDPAGFLQCYMDPEGGLMYSTWWDTTTEDMTWTMPAGNYAQAGQTYTMSLYNWYCCLNGLADSRAQEYTFNWGSGAIDEEVRLQLLSKLEEITLSKYFTIVTTSQFSATVQSAKFTNISNDYNVFMGFGSYRYMTVNYTDAEWATFVANNNNDLSSEYKKTN